MSARRTVVYAPNWVGDTVMALPVIHSLAASGRQVDVLARRHLVPLLGLVPGIGAVAADDDAATLAALAAGDYEEAVLLPNSFRSAWMVRRAGIAKRWGYSGGLRRPLLEPSVARAPTQRHQIEDYAELLSAMSIPAPADWTPQLSLTEVMLERGRELLARAGIDPAGGPIVGLFPGAEFGDSKRWPRESFEETARRLRRKRPDVQITILVGPKEVWLGVRLHEETGKIHPVIGADLDLADLAAVLAAHRALLTNDSGPMHLAAALGVRCVAFFGPTDPNRTAPSGEGHRVLTVARWCSPCFRRRCPLLHHKCMTEVGVDDAVAAIDDALVAGHG